MNIEGLLTRLKEVGYVLGLKVLSAIAIWIIGRWMISGVDAIVRRGLKSRSVDMTLTSYIANTLSVLLNIVLVVAILQRFGVETTSFAALLAAAGIAIGSAWAGMLSNFAAGAFMVILRPMKVGDFVTVGGVTGTVREIGIFVTAIDTPDNVRTYVGNTKVFGDTIQNYSTNEYRRVDLTAQLAHDADHDKAIALLREKVKAVKNVNPSVGPDVEILEFNAAGPVLCVRPYCHTDHYWQVYFDTNKVIREELGKAGFGVAAKHYQLLMKSLPASTAAGAGASINPS
jgi:small conductance mechanosensitive channel